MADFNSAIKKLLKKEGGGQVHEVKGDPGGLTKWGISQRAYPGLDIANLTKKDAEGIYKADYWSPLDLDTEASQFYAEQRFEAAVNMGVSTAKQLSALVKKNITDAEAKSMQFTLFTIERYRQICIRRKASRRFLLGWLNRVMGGV